MSQEELANSLNQLYVSVNADIPPLDSNLLPAPLPAQAGVLTVQPHEVCKKLLTNKTCKNCLFNSGSGRFQAIQAVVYVEQWKISSLAAYCRCLQKRPR